MRIVGGAWRGRRIAAPPGRQTRPTTDRVREAWMSVLGSELDGSRIVDLFAGSGALGIEALSRGAEHATFVESAINVMTVLKRNLDSLAVPPQSYRLVRGDVFRYIQSPPSPRFDIAFADPPYETGDAGRVAETFVRDPFATLLCIEHAVAEPLAGEPVWERRYGDTFLTFLQAPDEES